MSQENVEIAQRSIEAFLRGDWDGALSDFHPEVEWIEMPSLGPDAATYTGIEDVRGAVESWIQMWQTYDFEVSRYADAGDEVVVLARERASGSGSEAAVQREVSEIATVTDGKVVRVRLCGGWQEALKAAGLTE